MASPKVTSPNTSAEKLAPPAATEAVVANGQAAAAAVPAEAPVADEAAVTPEHIDDLFKELKTLLSTVEKLQKAREDVGDVKPLLLRLLDGELLSGDELEQLKSGVNGLSKLVKLYSDYQTALENAQPARTLLDRVLKS